MPPLPPAQKWCGWYQVIADLIPTLPTAQFAPWQIERMPELAVTSLVDGKNTIRQCTVRTFTEPSPCVTAHWLHRPCIIPRAFIVDGTALSKGLTIRQELKPVFTITASLDHRPIKASVTQGRVVAMTSRALARFQTFPNSYQLPDDRTLACRVVGNAVPPLLAQRLLSGID